MPAIRVILIDDQSQVHFAVASVFDANDDLVLVAQASSGEEGIKLIADYQPDVVLMDVVMPGMSGIEATRIIHETYPDIRILVVSSFQDDESVHAMLDNGAAGYVLKGSITSDLATTIRTVYHGHTVFSQEVSQVLLHGGEGSGNDFGLTEREIDVLVLMARGLNNNEIASELVISRSTVKFHIANVLEKMGVSTRAEAIVLAAKNKLV
ncbi:MAG: response regulator transcription factor [Chloroflexi bacterium]|nr:response regulator transcription factor [Chloroflexota bacterium]